MGKFIVNLIIVVAVGFYFIAKVGPELRDTELGEAIKQVVEGAKEIALVVDTSKIDVNIGTQYKDLYGTGTLREINIVQIVARDTVRINGVSINRGNCNFMGDFGEVKFPQNLKMGSTITLTVFCDAVIEVVLDTPEGKLTYES